MNQPTTDALLEAVLALTERYSIHATRDNGNKVRIRHAPRLTQLRDAITPSGNNAGGGSLARERNVIDTGALDLYRAIKTAIDDAARLVGATIDDHPETTLKRWLVAARHRITTDAYETEWAHRWQRHARAIDAKLNPPVQVEIMRPCPMCGERRAIDQHAPGGPALVTALVVQYHRGGDDMLDDATAMCRFCDAVWKGRSAIRAVAYDIEQYEQEATA